MAKTFIDMVQQANDAGWVVGDCFQLRSGDGWNWRVHLRDYSKSSEHRIASVYAEHAVLETAMASCLTQMQETVGPNAALLKKVDARLALSAVLQTWWEADPRFGKAFTDRTRLTMEGEV